MQQAHGLANSLMSQVQHLNSLDPRSSDLFDQMHRGGRLRQSLRFLGGSSRLLALDVVLKAQPFRVRRYAGTQAVAVQEIRGTMERQHDFDAAFRPLTAACKLRWQRVASAMMQGQTLPPVELVRVGDSGSYFVKDGHHRVSVARALGFRYVDAVVEEYLLPDAPAQ